MNSLGNKNVIAKNILYYMERAGKTRNDICKDLGFNYSTFSEWVNGNKYPRIDKIETMAKYFGIKKSDLIEEPSLPSNCTLLSDLPAIPVVGKIAAGIPILAEENIIGYIPTDIRNPQEYFYLRVQGDSMINAGISDGSDVLIHQQPCADSGQIIACRINGDEATLKRFKQVKDTVILMPENSKYQPILVNCSDFEDGYASILGVAVSVTVTKKL